MDLSYNKLTLPEECIYKIFAAVVLTNDKSLYSSVENPFHTALLFYILRFQVNFMLKTIRIDSFFSTPTVDYYDYYEHNVKKVKSLVSKWKLNVSMCTWPSMTILHSFDCKKRTHFGINAHVVLLCTKYE